MLSPGPFFRAPAVGRCSLSMCSCRAPLGPGPLLLKVSLELRRVTRMKVTAPQTLASAAGSRGLRCPPPARAERRLTAAPPGRRIQVSQARGAHEAPAGRPSVPGWDPLGWGSVPGAPGATPALHEPRRCVRLPSALAAT